MAVGFQSAGYPIVSQTVTVRALIQRPGHVPTAFDEQTLVADMQERANINRFTLFTRFELPEVMVRFIDA